MARHTAAPTPAISAKTPKCRNPGSNQLSYLDTSGTGHVPSFIYTIQYQEGQKQLQENRNISLLLGDEKKSDDDDDITMMMTPQEQHQ